MFMWNVTAGPVHSLYFLPADIYTDRQEVKDPGCKVDLQRGSWSSLSTAYIRAEPLQLLLLSAENTSKSVVFYTGSKWGHTNQTTLTDLG